MPSSNVQPLWSVSSQIHGRGNAVEDDVDTDLGVCTCCRSEESEHRKRRGAYVRMKDIHACSGRSGVVVILLDLSQQQVRLPVRIS